MPHLQVKWSKILQTPAVVDRMSTLRHGRGARRRSSVWRGASRPTRPTGEITLGQAAEFDANDTKVPEQGGFEVTSEFSACSPHLMIESTLCFFFFPWC